MGHVTMSVGFHWMIHLLHLPSLILLFFFKKTKKFMFKKLRAFICRHTRQAPHWYLHFCLLFLTPFLSFPSSPQNTHSSSSSLPASLSLILTSVNGVLPRSFSASWWSSTARKLALANSRGLKWKWWFQWGFTWSVHCKASSFFLPNPSRLLLFLPNLVNVLAASVLFAFSIFVFYFQNKHFLIMEGASMLQSFHLF